MQAVLKAIRILVIIQFISNARCQDGFSEQDLLRLQQIATNDGQVETITSYSTNIIQRDPNAQSISSVSVRYHMADPDKHDEYNRADRSRHRKVYRIKNPFQHPDEDDERSQDAHQEVQDSGNSASNQYASVQYSLPPDEFLQQMREKEKQYYQQQQLSTQPSNMAYTATPQPQYQHSTIPAPVYENNLQSNQIPQLEPKMSNIPTYLTNTNNYQYGGSNTFALDGVHSTPSPIPPYLSTSLPNAQFASTSSNNYVSSSAPIYLSSPPNLQHYVSSPISSIQSGTSDYNNNRVSSTVGSNSFNYDNYNEKKMQIDHYDNSANGVRYPMNMQQYQNEYPSSTVAPSSSPYSEISRESWNSPPNIGPNPVQKSLQELTFSQYQNSGYNNPDLRTETENINSDTHRIGNSVPSANNVFLSLVQPEYQQMNNLKARARDVDQDTAQGNYYSNGDYGWKLGGKKTTSNQDHYYPSATNQRYQNSGVSQGSSAADGASVTQMSFQMDVGRHGYDQISKSSPESLDAQEFAKAAAKAQERQQQHQQLQQQQQQQQLILQQQQLQQQQQQQQQQQYAYNYPTNYNSYIGTAAPGVYNDKQRNRYPENANSYSHNVQNDVITASPYVYANPKENSDMKSKLPFDHDKALKNIVPIDVSNVLPNSDSSAKYSSALDNSKYNYPNYGKDQSDLKQYYRSVTDAYYKDKNAIYGFNIKTKPDDYVTVDNVKQADNTSPYYFKPQAQESLYNQGANDNKRYIEGNPQNIPYTPQVNNNYPDNSQSAANVQNIQRPTNQVSDINNILKINDIPHRLTQGLSSDSLRINGYEQQGLPTQLPLRLNQNVGSHQLDVTNTILNKLLASKQTNLRPDIDSQSGGLISTINGFKVANPFNVDLKLVADMLKGKPTLDDSHLLSLRDPFAKPLPLKLDMSQLQQLLLKSSENLSGYGALDGLSSLSNPYLDFYTIGRYPYQGVKYSRSQEEEENIPIADASNNHPIGAVIEESDIANVREATTGVELTAQDEDAIPPTYSDDRPKHSYGPRVVDRLKHPNAILPSRSSYQRKHPKSEVNEPYPLLKPPPLHSPRNRVSRNKFEKNGRRRRLPKPKVFRLLKTEPLFEAGSDIDDEEPTLQTVLRPPSQMAEAKADIDVDKLGTPSDS